jgi:hypothetical protein
MDKRQKNVQLAHKLYDKAKKLGMRNPHTFSANMADIYFNCVDFKEHINTFLKAKSEDKETISQALVDIRITLEDAHWQWNQAKRSFERILNRIEQDTDEI